MNQPYRALCSVTCNCTSLILRRQKLSRRQWLHPPRGSNGKSAFGQVDTAIVQDKSTIDFIIKRTLLTSSRVSSCLPLYNFSPKTTMATIISGKEVSQQVQNCIKERIEILKTHHNVTPLLAIVQVGNREDSNVYIRAKIKLAQDVGMNAELHRLPPETTEKELVEKIEALNHDSSVHGIIVQLPFDCTTKINQDKITNVVSPDKDVDGLSDLNAGKLFHGQIKSAECFLPCTPHGCMQLIAKAGAKVEGSSCLVIGRSKIVGSPMAQLLLWSNATVTIAHSKTRNLPELCKQADIIVAAAGSPELVKGPWVKPGAVVIDCGITAVADSSKKSGKRLVGDVAFDEVSKVASAITPVPGGVGPMTVAMLISNTVKAAENSIGKGQK